MQPVPGWLPGTVTPERANATGVSATGVSATGVVTNSEPGGAGIWLRSFAEYHKP